MIHTPSPGLRSPSPKGDINTKITALTHDGRGIAHIDGKTVFIEGALPGEEVVFTYTSRRGKYDEGRVTEILTASSERTEPLCKHFSICGGCALQHMSSTAQLEMKQKILLDQLQHFGGIKPLEVLSPLTGPIWNYRRKARLSVKYVGKKEKVLVGFHEKNGRYIADLARCVILQDPLDTLITPLKEFIHTLKSYQHIPQIEVTITETITALVFRHLVPLANEDQEKLIAFAKQHQLYIYLQPKGPQSIHLLWPLASEAIALNYSLPKYNLELEFSPTDFIQINSEINQKMISLALELLDLQTTDQVLDLFCGIGNFSLPAATLCQQVTGIEGDNDLVTRARHNAHKNNLLNAEFITADLNQPLTASFKQISKILLDPPRTGALAIIQQLEKLKAQRIVYVSCNPATLARDAGELVKQGYILTKTGIMDMFPHTAHVEAIALFEKGKKTSKPSKISGFMV